MAENTQNNPKGGKKAAVRAFRPTHRTATLLKQFEDIERREGSAAIEYLTELGLAVWLAKDQLNYRLPADKNAGNVS